MGSPEKPFACTAADCGMRFTNEDHLTVHSRKHDLELQLALGNKSAIFPADQTPTPTRFIRNMEEVGLFQDLQNVNPFDEGFKRAMETKSNMLTSLDNLIAAATSDDSLHTPHIFPNLTDITETNLFNSNTKTITRSSSEESTTVKHFESTIETKLTNEVTIKDQKEEANNFITIQSNFEIRKADYSTIVASNDPNLIKLVVKNNEKNVNVVKKDVLLTDAGKIPVMSQKSIDFALDTLNSHLETPKNTKNEVLINTMKKNIKHLLKKTDSTVNLKKDEKRKISELGSDDYEIMIKLPNGELVHMKSYEVEKKSNNPKQKLKEAIEKKLKTTIEKEIRSDVENLINEEIKSGKFVLKVKSPENINSALIPPMVPTDNMIPVLVIPTKPTVKIVPMSKVPIPPFKLPTPKISTHISSPKCKRKKKDESIGNYSKLENLKKVENKFDSNCDNMHKERNPVQREEQKSQKIQGEQYILQKCNEIDKAPVKYAEGHNSKVILPNQSDIKKINPHEPKCDILNKVGGVCCCEVTMGKIASKSKNNSDVMENVIAAPIIVVSDTEHNVNESPQIDNEMRKNVRSAVTDKEKDLRKNVRSAVSDKEKDLRKERDQEAVRRYRARQREKFKSLQEENRRYERELREAAGRLGRATAELAALKELLVQHCSACPLAGALKEQCEDLLRLKR